MRTFEVGYKAYLREVKEWCADYIGARSKADALAKFARRHGIDESDAPSRWCWWDGDWYMAFGYVRPVLRKACPRCGGEGTIRVAP